MKCCPAGTLLLHSSRAAGLGRAPGVSTGAPSSASLNPRPPTHPLPDPCSERPPCVTGIHRDPGLQLPGGHGQQWARLRKTEKTGPLSPRSPPGQGTASRPGPPVWSQHPPARQPRLTAVMSRIQSPPPALRLSFQALLEVTEKPPTACRDPDQTSVRVCFPGSQL